jgi:hypothetical protein
VLRSDLAEHLGFVHSGWTTRQLRPQLDALRSVGLLRDLRRNGIDLLGLTSTGRWQRLAVRARSGSCRSPRSIASGATPALPPPNGSGGFASRYATHWMRPGTCSTPSEFPRMRGSALLGA